MHTITSGKIRYQALNADMSSKDTESLLHAPDSSDSEGKATYNALDGNVDMDSDYSETRNHFQPSSDHHQPSLVYLLTFMACLGGFLFGYDTGVVSGAMIFVRIQFNLTSFWHELIVSITIGAAAVFSLFGGYCNDTFGRKKTILVSSVLFAVGAVILGVAMTKEMLLVGRFVIGCGLGLASSTVPVYISETTPPSMRGRMVTAYNLAITFGLLCAGVIAGVFSSDSGSGWRWMLGLAAVPAILQFIGFWFMPESPRWLCQQQRLDEAKAVLVRLVEKDNVELELEAIQFSILDTENEMVKLGGSRHSLVRMIEDPTVRKILFLACGIQFFQQLSGINTVMYYSASIIQMSGVENAELAIWLAAVVAFINFIFTFVGIALVDKLGRRPLILASMVGVIGSLLFIGTGFALAAADSPRVVVKEGSTSYCESFTFCDPCVTDSSCGFCFEPDGDWARNGSCVPISETHEQYSKTGRCAQNASSTNMRFLSSYCPSHYGFMTVLGLGFYLAFFAPGMGPMPWTINSEIFPLWARSAGTGAATSVNWITNLLVSMTFLTLTETITKSGTMFLYACISIIGLVFLIKTLPETKGKVLEDIQSLFNKPWFSEGPSCGRSQSDEFENLDNM